MNDFYCAELDETIGITFPYFSMSNDTLKALVVFCNFPSPGGNWEPQNSILLQHWPGSSGQTKPSWADSIICPTTTNVWNRSLTGLFRDASSNKFWLIGDVYPDLYVFEHNISYYSPDSNRNIGYAVKELLENIDRNVDFTQYDRLDPRDIDQDNNRREPDGEVDFIFINFRFTNAHTIDPPTYSGIAALGGRSYTFAGSSYITLDGKKIMAGFPGSGAISEVWSPLNIGIPAHEFGEHYSYDAGHSFGLGSFHLNGGGLASASDREWLGWNTGIQYQPTSNTSITLRDFITTGDYLKISRNWYNVYFENRRRFSYYASENYKGVRWYSSEPLYPQHADSGLFIYKKIEHRNFESESANGNWDWQKCDQSHYRCDWSSSTYNIFFHDVLNRYNGQNTFDLYGLQIKDENCNTISGLPEEGVNYRGSGGDSNSFFDIGYNDVYSPWSNPPLYVANTNDSLTIEIEGRDENGDMILNIYFTNITDAKPSKPQELVVSEQYIGSEETHFYPKLEWEHNLEPDIDYYKIYRGLITTPGVEPTYNYIGSTSNNYYTDQNIILYVMQGGSGICTYQYRSYAYKVTAVDDQSKESVKSLRDTIDGYTDPCAPDDNIGQTLQLEYELKQNFPNPFNPETNIMFSLKERSYVTLKVYDISGKEIVSLVKEIKEAGNHNIIFYANKDIASGIYFYKISVENQLGEVYNNVKRMVLIK